MKKVHWLLAIALAVGSVGCSGAEESHKVEYDHHISQAFQGIQFTEESLRSLDETWETRTPQEVAGILFSIYRSLEMTTSAANDMTFYIGDHDDLDTNGNTGYFYYLFHNYQESIMKRLEETWKYTHETATVNDQTEYWAKLHKDVHIMAEDFKIIRGLDRGIFQDGEMSEMKEHFKTQIKPLQFEEVTKEYWKYER